MGHPFDTIKVRLQTGQKGLFSGAIDATMRTIRKEGVRRRPSSAAEFSLGCDRTTQLTFVSCRVVRCVSTDDRCEACTRAWVRPWPAFP